MPVAKKVSGWLNMPLSSHLRRMSANWNHLLSLNVRQWGDYRLSTTDIGCRSLPPPCKTSIYQIKYQPIENGRHKKDRDKAERFHGAGRALVIRVRETLGDRAHG